MYDFWWKNQVVGSRASFTGQLMSNLTVFYDTWNIVLCSPQGAAVF